MHLPIKLLCFTVLVFVSFKSTKSNPFVEVEVAGKKFVVELSILPHSYENDEIPPVDFHRIFPSSGSTNGNTLVEVHGTFPNANSTYYCQFGDMRVEATRVDHAKLICLSSSTRKTGAAFFFIVHSRQIVTNESVRFHYYHPFVIRDVQPRSIMLGTHNDMRVQISPIVICNENFNIMGTFKGSNGLRFMMNGMCIDNGKGIIFNELPLSLLKYEHNNELKLRFGLSLNGRDYTWDKIDVVTVTSPLSPTYTHFINSSLRRFTQPYGISYRVMMCARTGNDEIVKYNVSNIMYYPQHNVDDIEYIQDGCMWIRGRIFMNSTAIDLAGYYKKIHIKNSPLHIIGSCRAMNDHGAYCNCDTEWTECGLCENAAVRFDVNRWSCVCERKFLGRYCENERFQQEIEFWKWCERDLHKNDVTKSIVHERSNYIHYISEANENCLQWELLFSSLFASSQQFLNISMLVGESNLNPPLFRIANGKETSKDDYSMTGMFYSFVEYEKSNMNYQGFDMINDVITKITYMKDVLFGDIQSTLIYEDSRGEGKIYEHVLISEKNSFDDGKVIKLTFTMCSVMKWDHAEGFPVLLIPSGVKITIEILNMRENLSRKNGIALGMILITKKDSIVMQKESTFTNDTIENIEVVEGIVPPYGNVLNEQILNGDIMGDGYFSSFQTAFVGNNSFFDERRHVPVHMSQIIKLQDYNEHINVTKMAINPDLFLKGDEDVNLVWFSFDVKPKNFQWNSFAGVFERKNFYCNEKCNKFGDSCVKSCRYIGSCKEQYEAAIKRSNDICYEKKMEYLNCVKHCKDERKNQEKRRKVGKGKGRKDPNLPCKDQCKEDLDFESTPICKKELREYYEKILENCTINMSEVIDERLIMEYSQIFKEKDFGSLNNTWLTILLVVLIFFVLAISGLTIAILTSLMGACGKFENISKVTKVSSFKNMY